MKSPATTFNVKLNGFISAMKTPNCLYVCIVYYPEGQRQDRLMVIQDAHGTMLSRTLQIYAERNTEIDKDEAGHICALHGATHFQLLGITYESKLIG